MKIIKHSIQNILGLGLPLVAAIFSIPYLVVSLGDTRFGLLILVWGITGYFSLFDLGLGRALTQQIVQLTSFNKQSDIAPTIFTSLSILTLLGVFGALLMTVFSLTGIQYLKDVEDTSEIRAAIYWMALTLPAITVTSGLRGVLESKYAFGIVNLIRVPMGLLTFLGPVLVIASGYPDLTHITAILCLSRILGCFAHFIFLRKVMSQHDGRYTFNINLVKPLFINGGWMTLSNIVSPLMGYVDRFMLGIMISAAAVAYFVTPQEIVTKIWIIPGALTTVLFPSFVSYAIKDQEKVRDLFDKAVQALTLIVLPITLFLFLFADLLMEKWVGPAFASNSSRLLQIFSFGIFINCMAHIPYTLIQGAGESRLSALIHCIIFPIFILALWFLIDLYQETGAAIAWLLRILIDAALMFTTSHYIFKWPLSRFLTVRFFTLGTLAIITFGGVFLNSLELKMAWFFAVSVICGSIFIVKFLPKFYKSKTR